jgi:hypothetical protein
MARRQAGNAHGLADTATVRDIRLDDIDHAIGEQIAELVAGEEPLAGGDGITGPPAICLRQGRCSGSTGSSTNIGW